MAPEAVDGADTVKVRAACPASAGLFGERKVWRRNQPRRNPACVRRQRHIRVLITGLEENSITPAADFHGNRDLPAVPGEQAANAFALASRSTLRTKRLRVSIS
jgi:hypothetical protein